MESKRDQSRSLVDVEAQLRQDFGGKLAEMWYRRDSHWSSSLVPIRCFVFRYDANWPLHDYLWSRFEDVHEHTVEVWYAYTSPVGTRIETFCQNTSLIASHPWWSHTVFWLPSAIWIRRLPIQAVTAECCPWSLSLCESSFWHARVSLLLSLPLSLLLPTTLSACTKLLVFWFCRVSVVVVVWKA